MAQPGSWASKASSALKQESVVGYSLKGVFSYGTSQAANRVAGLSALASAKIKDQWFGGGPVNYGQVAADAFGNALGNFVVETMRPQAAAPVMQQQAQNDDVLDIEGNFKRGIGKALDNYAAEEYERRYKLDSIEAELSYRELHPDADIPMSFENMYASVDDVMPNARLDAAGASHPVLKSGRVLGQLLSLNTLSQPTLPDWRNNDSVAIYWKNDALENYKPYVNDGIRLLSGGITISVGASINFSGIGIIAGPSMMAIGLNEVVAASSSIYNRWYGVDVEGLNLMRDGLDGIYHGKGDAIYNAIAFGANAMSLAGKVPYKGYFNDSINGGKAILDLK